MLRLKYRLHSPKKSRNQADEIGKNVDVLLV